MNGTRRHSSAWQRLGALAVAIALVTVTVPAWAEPTTSTVPPAGSETTSTVLPGVTEELARLAAFKQELDELDR